MTKPSRQGVWSLDSKTDSRWNCSGEGFVGGLTIPEDAEVAMESLKTELGEEPPSDLEYSYMKE